MVAFVGDTESRAQATTNTHNVVRSCTSGNLVVIGCRWYGAFTVSSITCSGESPVMIGSASGDGTNNSSARSQWAYFVASSTGSKDISITLTGSANDISLTAIEMSGQHASPIGNNNNGAGGGTTPSISLTTSASNSAILGMCMAGSDPTTPGTGYSALSFTSWWSYEAGLRTTSMDAGAAGAKTVDWAASISQWHVNALEVKNLSTQSQAPRSANLNQMRS